ncbi:hypothetical protein [Qaidamihabitans albus]|uniref:hypothetical protein n=1 Tax=Qaidamihabitans albus TaxID=2795733 RepID=UPI0018F1964A|nr:hypothetical protein [Qaidamihabitans albus]
MNVAERLSAARAAQAATARELRERRLLRDRRVAGAEAAAAAEREKRAAAARRDLEETRQLQRRAEQAGGWATAARADPNEETDFGFEDAELGTQPVAAPPRRPDASPARSGPRPDDDDFAETDWVTD